MILPHTTPRTRRTVLGPVLLSALACCALAIAAPPARATAPKGPQPALRFPLSAFGFPGYSMPFLDAGSSMLTVHFVDATHVLLTFSMRGLLDRIPGDPPEDEDRTVAAKLIELPSGKILAQTQWRLHDHAQYLWPIGNGRFLLRVRSNLAAIAPLANVDTPEPFREMPFVHVPGQIDGVVISPDSEIVTIDSSKPRKHKGSATTSTAPEDGAPAEPLKESILFVHPTGAGTQADPVRAIAAGVVRADAALSIPLNGRGYMYADRGKGGRWALTFEGFDGKSHPLAPVDSTCAPRIHLVSYSQFVVFTCRSGGEENMLVSAWDFAPHEMWEEPLSGIHAFAFTTYAPAAGRFALSRTSSLLSMSGTSAGTSMYGATNVPQEQLGTQEIRVYQTESGDLLLKIVCSPIMRTGQNFDLSPDGMNLVAIRGPNLEIYRLPPLSKADEKDLAEVRAFEPPPVTTGRVEFRSKVKAAVQEAQSAEREGQPPPPASDTTSPNATPHGAAGGANMDPSGGAGAGNTAGSGAAGEAPGGDSNTSGDTNTPRRKPPTLLNPGEKPDEKPVQAPK